MSTTIKHTLASLIARNRPTLFYYRADAKVRGALRVRRAGDVLEIVNEAAKGLIRMSVANAVHLPDMIDSFDYYFGSAQPVDIRYRGAIYQLIDFSSPRLHYVRGFEDFPVLCPSSTEPYSTVEQYLDFAGIKPGGVVIDLGAYSGLTSIAFSKAVGPQGRVLALEPDPINFRSAEHNLAMHARINGLDNVVLHPMAASDRDGTLTLSSEGTMGSALTSIVGGYRGTTVEVQSRTLGTLAQDFSPERIDFVKIDIEGAESLVVPVSAGFLARYRPRLVIEGHQVGGVSTIEPIVAFLTAQNYDCRVEGQEGMTFKLILAAPR